MLNQHRRIITRIHPLPRAQFEPPARIWGAPVRLARRNRWNSDCTRRPAMKRPCWKGINL